MIHFEKVPFSQFKADLESAIRTYPKCFNLSKDLSEDEMFEILANIPLPTRSTAKSAGYDFCSPLPFTLSSLTHETVQIPLGIRVHMDLDKFLMMVPRSSQGFKYGVTLVNSVGIIDADYYDADNHGHIAVKLVKDTYHNDTAYSVNAGDKIVQGILLQYLTANNDTSTGVRTGGFGSTGT